MIVGILGMQGDYEEHSEILKTLGVDVRLVKLPDDLEGIDALILPGGESTHFARIIKDYGLEEALRDFSRPILGTCAGLILLAREVLDAPPGLTLGKLNVTVRRNAYGRQKDSFEAPVKVLVEGEKTMVGVFIRAPRIENVGEGVEILATLEDGEVVGVRQGNVLGLTFHPELAGESFFHRMLIESAR
ncbi:MAG: pyridoxal 5'-phosphate synthase glutaminase subunit PdxT [Thermotogae bacterium]|nr:pyridoxal 5'-phosphate synthase glutaminase subunit PdxT [Thermotogota bacterium]